MDDAGKLASDYQNRSVLRTVETGGNIRCRNRVVLYRARSKPPDETARDCGSSRDALVYLLLDENFLPAFVADLFLFHSLAANPGQNCTACHCSHSGPTFR